MTATELQRIAWRLSNSSWCRHWLNYYNSHDNVIMAIQCRDSAGRPEPVSDLERIGFVVNFGCLYTIQRTNDDGTPFVSKLF